LNHCVDLLSAAPDRDQVGIDRQIMVPKVVMQCLKMPTSLARFPIECQYRIGKQILADAIAAIKIEAG
jgi:hypothetical protein